MAQFELVLPKMGESVAEATIIKWLKMPGDTIEEDDTILEIATDKVDSEVPSPVKGKLVKQLFSENDVVQVGEVIAIIETGGGSPEPAPAARKESRIEEAASQASVAFEDFNREQRAESREPLVQSKEQPIYSKEQPTAEGRFYSPLIKAIAADEGISFRELDQIKGTGAEGRVTKDDLLDYVRGRGNSPKPAPVQAIVQAQPAVQAPPVAQVPSFIQEVVYAPAPPVQAPAAPRVQQPSPVEQRPAASTERQVRSSVTITGNDEIIEMDRMRRIIAEHMVMSKQVSPHVTSFVEADVTNLVKWREKVKNAFEKREGEKITFTPLFIEAVARAIKDMPMVNVSVDGTQIIKKRDINIGMAAALPSGNLIVPVIKNADQLNLVGITKTVNDLANRARNNKLLPDEIKDGTFTITNVGSFGNVMGTPIINQPQVAILAIGVIKKKPAVIETPDGDLIGIRHMMFLSLSYDHRVVDGALGGSFLRRIADYLEGWDLDREI